MRALLIGCSLLALTAPVAHAQVQTSPESGAIAEPRQTSPGDYLVFFAFDSAELEADARQTFAEAAEAYRRTGEAQQITATGHTDTSGSAEYNLELSQRRAEAVAAELGRQGVPATDIVTIGRGEEDLLVPTADGVREPRNRRVEIVVPQAPPPPEPAPVVAAPEPPPPAPAEPAPDSDAFTFALGPVYGHNFGETDGEDDKTENDLVGAELTFRALPGFLGGVSLKQMGLWSFNGIDDGLTGRTVASLDFAPDLGIVRPTLAINGGGVYGKGVQDGFVVGPEIRLDIAPFGGFNIGLKAAYDYQFRNEDWDEGILWAGLDLGVRF
jgi:outer membrane protein OmpA-like peptidoglycan-associated protein